MLGGIQKAYRVGFSCKFPFSLVVVLNTHFENGPFEVPYGDS